MQAANQTLISTLEDLLNASRIERGKMEFTFRPTDLQEITDALVKQFGPIAQMKNLKLNYRAPKIKLPQITADGEKIMQVVNNLIDNAMKYTHRGSVNVSLQKEDGSIVWRVKDTGIGIKPEELKKIFEKFGRGSRSIHEVGGLGLGLYVAKVVVDQHKGRLWVESEGEGKGSMFAVSLPMVNNLEPTKTIGLN